MWKSKKENENKKDKGKDKASSSVKIEEINTVSEELEDGDI